MTVPAPEEEFGCDSTAWPALILGRTQTRAKTATRIRFPCTSFLMRGIVGPPQPAEPFGRVFFSDRAGVRDLSKLAALLLAGNTVVGGDDLPLAANLHPDIG